jgi:pimeloyl-ACP methyl ester carboxylesterase
MPRLTRDDGVEIHWEEQGTGPLIVIAMYWSGHPSVFEPLIDELAHDHRIVAYDARGTGQSTRAGPHDMTTGATDLAALVHEVGGPAVVVTMTDGSNRAIRAATEDPDLISAVVATGTPPLGRYGLGEGDALIASDSVIEAFLQMLGRDYRGAQRTLMTTTNPDMTEGQIRERVNLQVAYCPQETAVERVCAWRDDDPLAIARQLGDRLWILSSPEMAGAWLLAGPKLDALIRELLPEAHLVQLEDGLISRPDLTAEIVRRITARTVGASFPNEDR